MAFRSLPIRLGLAVAALIGALTLALTPFTVTFGSGSRGVAVRCLRPASYFRPMGVNFIHPGNYTSPECQEAGSVRLVGSGLLVASGLAPLAALRLRRPATLTAVKPITAD